MFPKMPAYRAAKNAKNEDATEQEIIKLLVASGKSERDAKIQITFMKGMGSRIVIGDTAYGIKEPQHDAYRAIT